MRKVTLMKKPFMERYCPDTVVAEFAWQISGPFACLAGVNSGRKGARETREKDPGRIYPGLISFAEAFAPARCLSRRELF